MTEGPDPPWAKPKPRLPEARPTWVIVLAMAMLVFGGRLVIHAASQLSGPNIEQALKDGASAHVTQDLQALGQSLAQAYRDHPVAVRINAISTLVMGLLLLFAVAAVFASDPRARKATLLAAWFGIAYQIGDVIFLFSVFRRSVVAVAPMLVALAAQQAPAGKVPTASAFVSIVDVFIVVAGVVGVGFSVVLLTFFGGRRGRTFFGVGADLVGRQPTHGG
jgi:hypothetical protein